MNARQFPLLRRRLRSMTAIVICCGLVISFAALDQASARAAKLDCDLHGLASSNLTPEITLLRNAYVHLAVGNHDYKGHRANAMKAVAAAADLLGTDIRGDGKSKQLQPSSDDDLKIAQGLIEQALQMAEDASQTKVINHLKKAISEIQTALSVK